MKTTLICIIGLLTLTFAVLSEAQTSAAPAAGGKGSGPCKEIEQICAGAGFVYKEAKAGYGLWVDCIDPIMMGTAQPPKAVKPLPTVPGNLIAECKAAHPNFGSKHH